MIDKDLASALLADRARRRAARAGDRRRRRLRATGARPSSTPIREATPARLRAGDFAAGSMGPKVEAVCRFVEATGQRAAIGRLEELAGLVDGTAGTQVEPG